MRAKPLVSYPLPGVGLALFTASLLGCGGPPVLGGECAHHGDYACSGDQVLQCQDYDGGQRWLSVNQCLPGMCTEYGEQEFGCRAPNAHCDGSIDPFCSDNMVVTCTTDGKPIVTDDCNWRYTGQAPRYCVRPNNSTAPVCSYYPELCPVGATGVCVNVGQGREGFEGIVECDSQGIGVNFTYYVPVDGEVCSIRPCAVEGAPGCFGNLSGPNKLAICISGAWQIYYGAGKTCTCTTDCL